MRSRFPKPYPQRVVDYLGQGKIESIHRYAEAESKGEVWAAFSPPDTLMYQLGLFNKEVPLPKGPCTVAIIHKAIRDTVTRHAIQWYSPARVRARFRQMSVLFKRLHIASAVIPASARGENTLACLSKALMEAAIRYNTPWVEERMVYAKVKAWLNLDAQHVLA